MGTRFSKFKVLPTNEGRDIYRVFEIDSFGNLIRIASEPMREIVAVLEMNRLASAPVPTFMADEE